MLSRNPGLLRQQDGPVSGLYLPGPDQVFVHGPLQGSAQILLGPDPIPNDLGAHLLGRGKMPVTSAALF